MNSIKLQLADMAGQENFVLFPNQTGDGQIKLTSENRILIIDTSTGEGRISGEVKGQPKEIHLSTGYGASGLSLDTNTLNIIKNALPQSQGHEISAVNELVIDEVPEEKPQLPPIVSTHLETEGQEEEKSGSLTIVMVHYSERAGMIYGGTKPVKGYLNQCAHLKFNPRLKHPEKEGEKIAGYVFSLKQVKEVKKHLQSHEGFLVMGKTECQTIFIINL